MNDALRKSAQKTLAVTIAFTLGAAVISMSLYGLHVFGIGGEFGEGVTDWFQLAVMIISLSALAGLIIDALRLIATAVWPENPESRLSIREIVRQDLA